MNNCEVCEGDFETLKTKKEDVDNGFIKITVYMKCKVCGCGRIDYHPPFPAIKHRRS